MIIRYPTELEHALKMARRSACGSWAQCMDQTDEQFNSMLKRLNDNVLKAEQDFAIALGEFHTAVAIEAASRQMAQP